MQQTAVFPGRYVQSDNALALLGDEIARLGRHALLIAGGSAARSILPERLPAWREKFRVAVEHFGGECSEPEIERLEKIALGQGCDVVIGMGGGKVIDAAKAVGHAAKARVAIVPTIASTDAPTSAVAVIYDAAGAFSHYEFLPRNPDLVLMDTSVIAAAPVRFLVAGMGDALSTWFEADSCRQAQAPNQCGGVGTLAGYAIARLCYDTILEYGEAAVMACRMKVVTPALSHVVEANTLHSGLGFECGGLASAHSIHNGLTQLAGTHDFYHGEKVAIGVLAGLFLADRPKRLIEEVYNFCEKVGLPTTLAQIGLPGVTDDDLWIVARRACAEGETMHHEPCHVSPQAVLAALKTADAYGKRRRSPAGAECQVSS
ncbi:MAG TPA: glycerol dehydrogenase [Pirellulales bacterium]|nr:glycerol dehydrogenase [Pirellulales bacterium]